MTRTIVLPTLKELYKIRRRWLEDTETLEQKADAIREAFRLEKREEFSQELISSCAEGALECITLSRVDELVNEFMMWGSRMSEVSFAVRLCNYRVVNGKVTVNFAVEHNNRRQEEDLPLELSRSDWSRCSDNVTEEVASRLPRDISQLVRVLARVHAPKSFYDDSAEVEVNLTLQIRPEPGSESS